MRLVESVGSLAGEGTNVTGATVRERELEARGHELLDVRALDVLGLLDLGNLENVDRGETSTVTGSHVLVERLGGLSTGERTELLVHVVGSGSRVVSEPDSEVLDLEGLLLVDLFGCNGWKEGRRGSVLPRVRCGRKSWISRESNVALRHRANFRNIRRIASRTAVDMQECGSAEQVPPDNHTVVAFSIQCPTVSFSRACGFPSDSPIDPFLLRIISVFQVPSVHDPTV